MKILLLEDEIPAYEKLRAFLERHFKKSLSIDWSRSKAEAIELLGNGKTYDLIFSDIELLDGISLDIFSEIPVQCPIIFCTAFNQYVLDAFKGNGIAYILKPYSFEDIIAALNKYDTLFNTTKVPKIDGDILKEVTHALLHQSSYKSRFIIKTPKGIHLLSVKNISYIEASGAFCKFVDEMGMAHLFSQGIATVYASLDPQRFFKINRSQIINIDHILGMENYFKNRLLIAVKGSKEKLRTSSSSTAKFRIWLDS